MDRFNKSAGTKKGEILFYSSVISRHINNIFEEGKLERDSNEIDNYVKYRL